MILITGASGGVGSEVLAAAIRAGLPVKAMYRSKEDAGKAPKGAAAAVADFANRESLKKALEGVETMFLVCSPVRELVELEGNMIEACKESGTRHVVQNSSLGAGDFAKSFPGWHRKVEDKLKASGLKHTILRPNTFMQNITAYFAPSIRTQGAFYQSIGGARISLIDVRDIGEAAAKVMAAPEVHAGKVYEMNGPEAVNYAEVAERITRVTGRASKYVDIPFEAQRKALTEMGMPEWQVEALLDLQTYYTGGQGGETDETLRKLLGKEPRKLDAFLAEFAEQFAPQASKA